MAIGEVFIGAFITVLFEKLASGDLIRLARSAGIHPELNKLRKNLALIRAVLADAGEKHIRDRSVQLWLNELQHLAYEIDDVLDELATEAMRRQLNKESYANASTSTSTKLKFIPSKLHAIKYGLKMRSKLEGITTKLRELVEEKNLLGLEDDAERPKRGSRRSEETSLLPIVVIGRESDKKALLGKLLGSESSNSQTPTVNVVSIVGLGGIGKTTLAQLVYNDNKVKEQFELMAWVCVSDEFDVFGINKAIFQAVGGGNQDFASLNLLQVALSEKLSKKKFLLVLDDVWNENYKEWELLQRPFYVGAPGSKVLVTTRKTMVASVMGSVQTYPLEILSDEEALSLFAQYALGKPNFDSRPTTKLHGEAIVKKCGGLPLALRTLGWVLRTKSNDEEWEELLNSDLWNSQNESEILPALRLSYYDLPGHLKQMFVYCCLFPKDYIFDKDELVLLWMAEGFLDQPKGDKLVESFGGECFEELVSRSFFQHSTNDKSLYTMHDLINDLATSIAGEFFFTLDDKMDVYNSQEALEKVYHLSYIRESYGAYKKYKALQRARRLRTLLAVSLRRLSSWETFYIPNMTLIELLSQLKFLRVVNLANYNITEVPPSVGSLKHMRYLNFSNTQIRCLPEQVGDLVNLQSLLLSSCRELSSLPNSIAKLINLRHLDITNTPRLNNMLLGLGGLTSLQTLPKIIIGGVGDCRISDLKGMLHLRGQLSIEGLHEVKDAMNAKEAHLQQKKGICDLRMEWTDVFDDSRNGKTEYEVLTGLRPSEKLVSLEIVYYGGTKLPSWVGDPSFVCLTRLTLRGCRSCTCLPTLGHLHSLKELFVESMDGLKSLGSDLLRPSNSWHGIAFPSLEVLKFKDMKSWEEWLTSGGETAGAFPCLHQMSIINCPKLDVVAMELIPSLQVLLVKDCSIAVLRGMVGMSKSIATLTMNNIKGLTQLHGETLEHLKAVEDLSIWHCDELTYLWESEATACEILVNLKSLSVGYCASLESFGEKEEHLTLDMKSITQVTIYGCPRLERYRCPNSIEKLEIEECESLVSLGEKEEHLKMGMEFVKEVSIKNCPRLERYLCPNSIQILEISKCPRLERYNCPNSIEKLEIIDCESLVSFGEKEKHLKMGMESVTEVTIGDCPRVESYNCPNSVEKLRIYGCPSLSLTFPTMGDLPSTLKFLEIKRCDNIESILDNGYGFLPFLCLRCLVISDCKNLKSFPHEQLQKLTSLEEIVIWVCPSLDFPFPCGLWPPNLRFLSIGGLKKPISEWGLQNFPPSLFMLHLYGDENSGVVSFGAKTDEEDISSFRLPSSLIYLNIWGFNELESVSEGMQHLTCLQHLNIHNCRKLRDLPETLLPSLSSLVVVGCSPELMKKCSRSRKGKYWPMISQIPHYILD
ncbi:putative virus X resistance protein-like, coiled-coil [Helianthus debilis subsp. tardiflorus]